MTFIELTIKFLTVFSLTNFFLPILKIFLNNLINNLIAKNLQQEKLLQRSKLKYMDYLHQDLSKIYINHNQTS